MKPKPTNKIVARYPYDDDNLVLWELPGQGIYLGRTNNVNLTRICSREQFLAGLDTLKEQGWILKEEV
jgi:hypothetical protein